MADNETTAEIIAEMRGARTEFPFVYLIGEPDTPEIIDRRTKAIVEPRKINIRRVTVKELADRFEAAHKRELGDCAKLRKALVAIKALTDSYADDLSLLGTVYRTANAFLKEVGDGNSQQKEGGIK